jgi:hypothetical protein
MTPWLTDPEIDNLCEGLVNNAAKIRYLRTMGLTVHSKPSGRPLVMRSHAEAVLSGAQQMNEPAPRQSKAVPNIAQFRQAFGKTLKAA